MTNVYYEFGAAALGAIGLTVSWKKVRDTAPAERAWPAVNISQSSNGDDGIFQPACDVMVSGRDNLLILRNAIDCALGQEGGAA